MEVLFCLLLAWFLYRPGRRLFLDVFERLVPFQHRGIKEDNLPAFIADLLRRGWDGGRMVVVAEGTEDQIIVKKTVSEEGRIFLHVVFDGDGRPMAMADFERMLEQEGIHVHVGESSLLYHPDRVSVDCGETLETAIRVIRSVFHEAFGLQEGISYRLWARKIHWQDKIIDHIRPSLIGEVIDLVSRAFPPGRPYTQIQAEYVERIQSGNLPDKGSPLYWLGCLSAIIVRGFRAMFR
jgi:hypothetical protein